MDEGGLYRESKMYKHTFSNNLDDFLLFLSRLEGEQGPESVVQRD